MRQPFAIDENEISHLNAYQFARIVNRLLWYEAWHLGISPQVVETSLRVTDPDEGIDARVRAGDDPGRWLPGGLSVWQFKAGRSPGRVRVRREVRKRGVREALAAGGTYVLALAASLTPESQEKYKKWLKEFITEVQSDGREPLFLCASQIARWASQYPAMLFDFGRKIGGVWQLDDWVRRQQQEHGVPFEPHVERTRLLASLRDNFLRSDGPMHVRLHGQPGVGKTRLVLEAFRGCEVPVLYAQEPIPPRHEFLSWMAYSDAYAVLVVDECSPSEAARLEQTARMSGGRLRLVTIGHSREDREEQFLLRVDPLPEETLLRVVHKAAPILDGEQALWIARMSRGYVKLATRLAQRMGERVAMGETVSVMHLTASGAVQEVFNTLLPDKRQLRAARGLALLTHVGWDDDVAPEGRAIAEFIGMNWMEMCELVADLVDAGVVVKAGRYRYVTPDILGLWLAGDAWKRRLGDISELRKRLPTEGGQNAMIERMSSLSDVPEVAEVLRDILGQAGPFHHLGVVDDGHLSWLFYVLARGQPGAALAALQRILSGRSFEDLLAFREGRFYIVRTLERLARHRDTFFDAARLLLRLAETENETWSNNATGIWESLFLTHLGGTEVPAVERYRLLDEALSSELVKIRELAVGAVGSALTASEIGQFYSAEPGGYVLPRRWQPATWDEDLACRLEALRRLERALNDAETSVRNRAFEVLPHGSRNLVRIGLVDDVADSFEALDPSDEAARFKVWEAIQGILRYEAPRLTDAQKERFARRAAELVSDSLHDKMRRFVGRPSHADLPESGTPPEALPHNIATGLAAEAIRDPDALRAELSWLASGEAENAWYFGRGLGQCDANRDWLDALLAAAKAGADARVLSGYLQGRADAGKSEWRDDLLDTWAQDSALAGIVFDATWRGEPSARGLARLVRLADIGGLEPGQLRALSIGRLVYAVTDDDLATLLDRMMRDLSAETTEASLSLLTRWAETHAHDLSPALVPAAWALLERTADGKRSPMLSFYWEQVGHILVRRDATRAARAVLAAIAAGDLTFDEDCRLIILREAIAADPAGVWQALSSHLLQGELVVFRMCLALADLNVLEAFDVDTIVSWARGDPDERAAVLAELINPQQTISRLVRLLLREFGPESAVAAALCANFSSGTWSGSEVAYLERKLETVKQWLQDEEPNVRRWAQRIAGSIQREIPQVRRREEEEFLR